MNVPSKITVDYSSLVGLKAEVLRKQLEVKELKSRGPVQNIPNLQKPKVKVKKPRREDQGAQKVTEVEDVSTLKKSQLMLEAKSRLYDELQKSRSNSSDLFLVDFSQKPDSESKNAESVDDLGDEHYDSDDNFVEYQDCFGRTRKCLREDLPKMREKDNLLKQQIYKEPPTEPLPELEPDPVVEEKIETQRQPEIVLMRKKWEEQTKKLANKVNIHYQDVLFDEARAHGVGYFNFSLDENERQKQQGNLKKLRKETEQKQKEMKDLKEARKKMEQNRLRVARIRQRIRAGLPPELPEDEVENLDDPKNSEEAKPEISDGEKKPEEKKEPENSLAIIEDKVKAFGELLGKRTQWREMSQEEWVDKRRKDRLSEFAPTYSGFKSAGCIEFENLGFKEDRRGDFKDLKKSSPVDEDNKDDDDSEVIGPMPISIPLSTTNASPSIPLPSSWNENKSLWHEKRFELDEDSDNSDIIGPMPPEDFPALIPLPPNPLPSLIPLPASPKESISRQHVSIDDSNLNVKSNIDSDRILAGLRFLREKFEKEKKKGS